MLNAFLSVGLFIGAIPTVRKALTVATRWADRGRARVLTTAGVALSAGDPPRDRKTPAAIDTNENNDTNETRAPPPREILALSGSVAQTAAFAVCGLSSRAQAADLKYAGPRYPSHSQQNLDGPGFKPNYRLTNLWPFSRKVNQLRLRLLMSAQS